MGLKDLTSEKLEAIQNVLALFEFYGISEDDIRALPQLIKDVAEFKEFLEKVKVVDQKGKTTKEDKQQVMYFGTSEDLLDE